MKLPIGEVDITDKAAVAKDFAAARALLNLQMAEFDDDPGSLTADDSLVASGLVVKAQDTGRVLMLQRSFDDPDDIAAGQWEFPGGRFEPGDSDPWEVAKREWQEELGVPLPEGEVAGSWTSPNGVWRGYLYLIERENLIPNNPDPEHRTVLNPDDPDHDGLEVFAWWEPSSVPGMAALRPEVNTSDWNLILRAAESAIPDSGADVVIEPDDVVRAPEMEHMGPRPQPHVHDPDDPLPVLVFDLHGTLTKTNGFPLIFPPFPGVKEYMDRMAARGACLHIATAGLDELDELVNTSRLDIIWTWCGLYGLPVSHIGPKANAHVFYDDRMIVVNRDDPHWDLYAAEAEERMLEKFDLDPETQKYVRKAREKTGDPIAEFPTLAASPPDRPRGFTSNILEADVHRCISYASGSQRTASLKPGAKEILALLYNSGYTIQIGCAGWNPATHERAVWEGRYGAQGQYLYEQGIPFDRRVSKDHGDLFHDDKGFKHTDWYADFPKLLEALHAPGPEHNVPMQMAEHTTDTKTPETTAKKTDQHTDPQKRKRNQTHEDEPRTGRTAADFEREGPALQEDAPSSPTPPGALQSDARAMVQTRGSVDEKSGTGLERGVEKEMRDVSALGGLPADREMGQTPVDLGLHDHPVLNRLYVEAMNRYANLIANGVARHHALAAVKRIDPDFYVQEAQHAWLYTQLAQRAKGQKGHPPTDTDKPDPEPGFPTLVKMGDLYHHGLLLAIAAFEASGRRQPELLLMGWSPPQPTPPPHVTSVYDQYEWAPADSSALSDYLGGLYKDQYLETLNEHLTRSGAAQVSEITDPEILASLEQHAADVAAGVGNTFNNDLANQVYGTWIDQRSELGTQSSRYTLQQEIDQWAQDRANWKADDIALTEAGWAAHAAADAFFQNNPEAALTGHVEPTDAVCEECKGLVDQGTMDAADLMAIDFPVHPNCSHGPVYDIDPNWAQNQEVWAAQAPPADEIAASELQMGDSPGHEFHGNQYVAGAGGSQVDANTGVERTPVSGAAPTWPTDKAGFDAMTQDPRHPSQTMDGQAITAETQLLVFHATTPDDAKGLLKYGLDPAAKPMTQARLDYESGNPATFSPGQGVSNGLYVGGHPIGVSGYGRAMVAANVRAGDLAAPPEMSGGPFSASRDQQAAHDLKDTLWSLSHGEGGAVITTTLPPAAFREFGSDPKHIPSLDIKELKAGEGAGHPFRGNQYTTGESGGGGEGGEGESRSLGWPTADISQHDPAAALLTKQKLEADRRNQAAQDARDQLNRDFHTQGEIAEHIRSDHGLDTARLDPNLQLAHARLHSPAYTSIGAAPNHDHGIAASELIFAFGDQPGHDFHGNQYTGGMGGGAAADMSMQAWSHAVSDQNALLTEGDKRDAFYVYDAESQTEAHYANSGNVYVDAADAKAYADKLAAKYAPTAKVTFNASADLEGDAGETTLLAQADSYRIDVDHAWLSQSVICHEMAHVMATEKVGQIGHGASFREAWVSILRGEMPSLAKGIEAELAKSPPALTMGEPQVTLKARVTTPNGQSVICLAPAAKLQMGDVPGHPFRGNQYASGSGGGSVADYLAQMSPAERAKNQERFAASNLVQAKALNALLARPSAGPRVVDGEYKTDAIRPGFATDTSKQTALARAISGQEGVVTEVPLDQLTATKPYLSRTAIAATIKNLDGDPAFQRAGYLPLVAKQGGKSYIVDGHHRTEGALLLGHPTIQARVFDLDSMKAGEPRAGVWPDVLQVMPELVLLGDLAGHDFHGNQWTGGVGGGSSAAPPQAAISPGILGGIQARAEAFYAAGGSVVSFTGNSDATRSLHEVAAAKADAMRGPDYNGLTMMAAATNTYKHGDQDHVIVALSPRGDPVCALNYYAAANGVNHVGYIGSSREMRGAGTAVEVELARQSPAGVFAQYTTHSEDFHAAMGRDLTPDAIAAGGYSRWSAQATAQIAGLPIAQQARLAASELTFTAHDSDQWASAFAKLRADGILKFGDVEGHDFHGNQWTGGMGGGGASDGPLPSQLQAQLGRGWLPRDQMPVVPGKLMASFAESLARQGVTSNLERVDPRTLIPTQNQLDPAKVNEVLGRLNSAEYDRHGTALGERHVMVSRDGHILDGHHRWAANVLYANDHPGHTIAVLRMNTTISNLLTQARAFDQGAGLHPNALAAAESPDPSQPYVEINGQWILVATDESDGVPRSISQPSPVAEVLKMGDVEGHPFRGNQWTGGISGAAGDLGRTFHVAATALEPRLTPTLQALAQTTGGDLNHGGALDYRVKSERSLVRKIAGVAKAKSLSETEAAAKINDANRYTMTFPEQNYASGIHDTLAGLTKQGYGVSRVRNYWPEGNQYRGVNAQIRTPAGDRFELQFHTPQSHDLKEGLNHPLYERWRDATTPASEKASLDAQMRANSASLKLPPGTLNIGEVTHE